MLACHSPKHSFLRIGLDRFVELRRHIILHEVLHLPCVHGIPCAPLPHVHVSPQVLGKGSRPSCFILPYLLLLLPFTLFQDVAGPEIGQKLPDRIALRPSDLRVHSTRLHSLQQLLPARECSGFDRYITVLFKAFRRVVEIARHTNSLADLRIVDFEVAGRVREDCARDVGNLMSQDAGATARAVLPVPAVEWYARRCAANPGDI